MWASWSAGGSPEPSTAQGVTAKGSTTVRRLRSGAAGRGAGAGAVGGTCTGTGAVVGSAVAAGLGAGLEMAVVVVAGATTPAGAPHPATRTPRTVTASVAVTMRCF